jgi:hypothetical protein
MVATSSFSPVESVARQLGNPIYEMMFDYANLVDALERMGRASSWRRSALRLPGLDEFDPAALRFP